MTRRTAWASAGGSIRRFRAGVGTLIGLVVIFGSTVWEFKILRSAASQFGNPAWLRSMLEEEARAGWIMIEKFDNSRVRLKRLASARVNDATLGFDPYRTWVGISQTRFALMIVLGALGGTLALFLLIMFAAGAFSR
jgi:hypothetical protein